jgi:hypothetical protein
MPTVGMLTCVGSPAHTAMKVDARGPLRKLSLSY